MARLRFGALGSLEVVDEHGAPLDIGGTQPRTVLAVLLAAGGRVVSTEALLDAVWGDDPPPSAAGTLQSYVSRLRRTLEPGRGRGEAPRVLVSEPPGYRLALAHGDVDFQRFEALADEGRALLAAGRFEEARAALVAADGLWRGAAFAEFADQPFAVGVAARLEDRRQAAAEDRMAAELALGNHASVVGELTELVASHPLRERLREQLALALYRAGRQAEALRAIDDARRTLVEELGVDPSPPLRELEVRILAQDPALAAPAILAVDAVETAAPRRVRAGDRDGFVGRDAEVETLVAALEEAMAATRIAVVEGEPGIGKTRLAEEVAAEAAARGFAVLWGRAFEGGAAPSFWPWLPPLRALAAALPETVVPRELAVILSPSAAGEIAHGGAEVARFTLFEAIAELLATAARKQPLMLVLDDVQWADAASLELLSSVASRLADAPLLIVCTVRELEVGRNDAVVDTLATLTRYTGTRRLLLRGLDRRATAELVRRAAGDEVAGDLAVAIHERADGNPFFATELARLVARGDRLGDVPAGVRDVVRRRLAQLPEPTRELLQVAAVAGRDLDLGLLARAADRDLETCIDDLEPAVVQRLLVADPDEPGRHRFVHALVREVIVDDVSTLRRARLHLRVADALDDSDDNAEIVAEHLWAAVPVGVARRAADALERAAVVAVRRLSYGSAQDLLERAVSLRRATGAGRDDLEAELRTLALLVSVTAARGGYASVTRSPLVARGKRIAEELGQDAELLNLLWAEWAGLDVSNRFEQADPIAAELLNVGQDVGTPLARALGHTAYGIGCWHRGEIDAAAEHLGTASDAIGAALDGSTSPLFDLDQLRLAMPFAVYIRDLRGDLDDPEARYDEVARTLPGDRYWELLVMNFAASAAMSVGDMPRALRACERGLAADPDGVSAFWSMALRAYYGGTLCLAGRLDEGLPILDDAWTSYTAAGLRTNGVTWLASRGHGLALAGRLDEAAESLREAEDVLARYRDLYARPTLLLATGVLAHARGDGGSAASALRESVALATAQGSHAIAAWAAREAARLGVTLA